VIIYRACACASPVVHGRKRWAFIEPSVPEEEVLGPASHYQQGLPAADWCGNGNFMMRTEAVTEITPRFYSFLRHPSQRFIRTGVTGSRIRFRC
jgi:hypothetical protein